MPEMCSLEGGKTFASKNLHDLYYKPEETLLKRICLEALHGGSVYGKALGKMENSPWRIHSLTARVEIVTESQCFGNLSYVALIPVSITQ